MGWNSLENIQKVAQDIKSIKIQWANNIAESAFKVMKEEILSKKFKKYSELKEFIETWTKLLIEARSTEPMLFNGIKYALYLVQNTDSRTQNLQETQKKIADSFDYFLDIIRREKKIRAEIWATFWMFSREFHPIFFYFKFKILNFKFTIYYIRK